MKKIWRWPASLVAVSLAGSASAATPRVLAVHFDADVNPVTADYVNQEIDQAEKKGYDAVVIVLDTPGGLSDSMRKIYLRELSAKIPVIVLRLAAAGLARPRQASGSRGRGRARDGPRTNIGSSTPINGSGQDIGGDLRRKIVNDAAASLHGALRGPRAERHLGGTGRRKASNLTGYGRRSA